MGSAQTGLNPGLVNNAITVAKDQGNNVTEAVRKGFEGMLESLKSNWGTQDGKTWVEGEALKSINDMNTQIKTTLDKIPEVISKVGKAQLTDTKNDEGKVNGPAAVTERKNSVSMNIELDNHYVGVYTELQSDLSAKESELVSAADEAIGKLQALVIEATDKAFNVTGAADRVSAECTIYINRVKNIIDKGLTKLNEDISAEVAKADAFVKDVQNSGLRGAANFS